ncbi:VOC family protein [Niabella sp. W65]|jgi:lactoylglutathione lyase|nr:VOC family protein [Niabella sp. W65]MCH7368133.1 VOC family protein [Niabella sp. W65]
MKIEHIAFWVEDLEKAKDFYLTYFDMMGGDRYHNPAKNFTSYFLSFKDGGTRIELMHRPDIAITSGQRGLVTGITHLAISVGSKEQVDVLTERLKADGYTIAGEPRTTGDGYYESVVLDPEGNLVEITE